MKLIKQHALAAGLILMFAFTWPVDLLTAAYTRGLIQFKLPEIFAILVGYGIVIATILITAIISGRTGVAALLRRFLIWRVHWKWYLVALFLPPILMLVAIVLNSAFTQTLPDFQQSYIFQLVGEGINPLLLIIPFFIYSALTNGEEIGWRGFALPRFQNRYNALVSSLILGVIWAFWHLPKYLMVDTTLGGGHALNEFFIESAKIVAHAILFTWVFNNTKGSLLLATLFHAAFNTGWVFLPMQNLGAADLIVYWLAAVLVVILTGPAFLVRGRKMVEPALTAEKSVTPSG
jgi:membrane protease YdiL (CAAX protease family)